MIVADDEVCQALREDLYARPELIPQEAIEDSFAPDKEELSEGGKADDTSLEELLEEADFCFSVA